MEELLVKKISTLSEEAKGIIQERERLESAIQQLDVRLHQIAGAISEIDSLFKEIENAIRTID